MLDVFTINKLDEMLGMPQVTQCHEMLELARAFLHQIRLIEVESLDTGGCVVLDVLQTLCCLIVVNRGGWGPRSSKRHP
jgi:hypothetical protein